MHSYTEEIVIEKNVVKYIVGKSGSAINRLKDQYDVKIEIEVVFIFIFYFFSFKISIYDL